MGVVNTMSGNSSQKTVVEIVNNGTWVAPTGVTSVSIYSISKTKPVMASGNASLTGGAITHAGDLYVWGSRIADGTASPPFQSSPVIVAGGNKYFSASGSTSLGAIATVLTNYSVMTWGANGGKLGNNSTVGTNIPQNVVGGIKYISAGVSDVLALLAENGTAYCSGPGTSGQLGNNTTTSVSSPVAVAGGLKFCKLLTIGISFGSTIGITSDGTAYGWGRNQVGQLGDGTTLNRSSPVLVAGGLKFEELTGSNSTFFGRTKTGEIYAWGQNNSGVFGNGTLIDSSSPILILGSYQFRKLELGSFTAYGLTDSGDLYAWGNNSHGQFGNGTTTSTSTPVLVSSGLKFVNISGCGTFITALSKDMRIYAWGENEDGNLGDGTVVSRSSPVLVLGGLRPKAVEYQVSNKINVPVIPGQTYNVFISNGVINFGNTAIGNFTDRLVLEY